MSKSHKIVDKPTFPPVNEDTRFCPACRGDWQGNPIPEKYRERFYGGRTHYSNLIGVEIPEKYDGVDHWRCPFCQQTFPRVHP